jgi:hypothetical protein
VAQQTQSFAAVLALTQTILITVGGFLLIKFVATAPTMSDGQMILGPLSLALMWTGLAGSRRPGHD